MSAGRLSVGSLAVRARIPRDQPEVPGLAGDLRELVPRLVVPRVAALLERSLPQDDPAVWLIRELRVELAVGARWDADRIAAHIAAAIGDGIERALHGDGGTGVTRVDDRATHLGAVLSDVAAGSGRRWYHGAYAATAADGTRAHAFAALLDDAGTDGPRALGLTGATTAMRIVRALEPDAVVRLARAWNVAPDAPAAVPVEPVRRLVSDAAALVPFDLAMDAPRAAVLTFALACAAEPFRAPAAVAAAVRSDVKHRRAAFESASAIPSQRTPSVNTPAITTEPSVDDERAVAKPPTASALRRVSQPDTAVWTTLTESGALFLWWRAAIESGALAAAIAATHSSTRSADGIVADDAAAIIVEDVSAIVADEAAPMVADSVRAALALARALGGANASVRFDSAVRALLRLDDCDDDDDSVPRIRLEDVLDRALDAADTGWPPLRPDALLLEALGGARDRDGERAYVLADAATGRWLWAWVDEPSADQLGTMLATIADRFADGPLPLLADAVTARRLLPDRSIIALDDGRVWALAGSASDVPPMPAAGRVAGFLARELGALSLSDADGETRLAWAFLAQLVVRDLARRLPGFAHASTVWLRANVLPRAATVRYTALGGDESALDVELEPPPLAMLLRIAGQVPVRYALPGAPVRTVALRLEGR